MIGASGIQHQHSHEPHFQQRSVSRSRDREAQSQQARSGSSPRTQSAAGPAGPRYPSHARHEESATEITSRETLQADHPTSNSGAARLPSPPPSSSPSEASSATVRPKNASPAYTVTAANQPVAGSAAVLPPSAPSSSSHGATEVATSNRTMPHYPARWQPDDTSSASGNLLDPGASATEEQTTTQTTIRVRDLAHIQSLAKADLLTATGPGILNDPPLQQMKYDISGMPIADIIEMVAALLTKITTTNDLQHDAPNRNANHIKQVQAQAVMEVEGGNNTMSPLSSSVLAFHGKNVPAITILSYLSRIHKYCPTTFEVFLSLLVYFDRMTERVNYMVMKSEEARRQQETAQAQVAAQAQQAQPGSGPAINADKDVVMTDTGNEPEDETDSDLADEEDETAEEGNGAPAAAGSDGALASQATYFVVDSFNIHRLIIAGVTCASKFFSDVFYTNSRYAKVRDSPWLLQRSGSVS